MSGTAVQDLERAVDQAIRKYLPDDPGDISGTTSLEEIGVDSMTLVDIVLDLQSDYSVELPDDALADIHGVGDLVDSLRALLAAQAPDGMTRPHS